MSHPERELTPATEREFQSVTMELFALRRDEYCGCEKCIRAMKEIENVIRPILLRLEQENAELKRQLDVWEANEPCPECGEKHICGLQDTLQDGVNLVEGAFAHVSHGGPTRADAEEWVTGAKLCLKK